MKAVLKFKRSSMLSDHQRGRSIDFDMIFPLTVGREYLVLGMSVIGSRLDFLVQNDRGTASFAPAGLFELTKTQLPPEWHFGLLSGIRASGRDLWANPVVANWGYPELVYDAKHGEMLELEDPAALQIFASRMEEARRREM